MMQEKKYLLAIRRGKNDYLPLEWELTNIYKNQDLNSLEGIDSFTCSVSKDELLKNVLKENIVEGINDTVSFCIIFVEKDRFREVKEGVIFKEKKEILNFNIVNYIIDNIKDKKVINMIYNICDIKNGSVELTNFKLVIKNIDIFLQKGVRYLKVALNSFNDLSYEERRVIIIKIYEKLISKFA